MKISKLSSAFIIAPIVLPSSSEYRAHAFVPTCQPPMTSVSMAAPTFGGKRWTVSSVLWSANSPDALSEMKASKMKMTDNDGDGDGGDDQPALPKPAGIFFHQVPPSDDSSSSSSIESEDDSNSDNNIANDKKDAIIEATMSSSENDGFDDAINKSIEQRRKQPLASRPSTINGVPTEKATGFGKTKNEAIISPTSKKTRGSKPNRVTTKQNIIKNKQIAPYVAIDQPDHPINDPSKPERDDQGYTLCTDTKTGEKSRVFEALVDYPSVFTMKIVGANEESFVPEIVALVAEACESDVDQIEHSTKVMGKWVSVTVQAPVETAEMLYSLYEKVDLDTRVKFKF